MYKRKYYINKLNKKFLNSFNIDYIVSGVERKKGVPLLCLNKIKKQRKYY